MSDDTGDRAQIALPPVQVEYLRKLALGGAKVVLVATSEEMAKEGRYDWYVDAIMNDPETANFPGAWGVHSATNPHWLIDWRATRRPPRTATPSAECWRAKA